MTDKEPTFKQMLLEKGVLVEFNQCLDELRKVMRDPKAARRAALIQFLGEEIVARRIGGNRPTVTEEGEVVHSGKRPKPIYVDMAVFEGRECSELEAIRWVAKVMDMGAVKVADCPGPIAWNMLNYCREDPDFKKTFWSGMFMKAIPRGSGGADDDAEYDENGKRRDVDGRGVLDLCERLMEISGVIKGDSDVK